MTKNNFRIPGIGTTASQDFFDTYLRIHSFFLRILYIAKRIDELEEADDKLLGLLHDPKIDDEIKERLANHKKMVDVVKDNRQFFLETALVRHVENYLNYLSSLLFEIFTQKPETLRSSEKIEIATVLDCENISDVVRVFAEKKVENLSFSSIGNYTIFLKNVLSSNFFLKT